MTDHTDSISLEEAMSLIKKRTRKIALDEVAIIIENEVEQENLVLSSCPFEDRSYYMGRRDALRGMAKLVRSMQ
jgi:hypothetical protein